MTKRRISSTDYILAEHFHTLRLIVQLAGFRPLCLKKSTDVLSNVLLNYYLFYTHVPSGGHQKHKSIGGHRKCSLSLWRVVRGIKLTYVASRIHGLFIT
jgi:hypothetical protein